MKDLTPLTIRARVAKVILCWVAGGKGLTLSFTQDRKRYSLRTDPNGYLSVPEGDWET